MVLLGLIAATSLADGAIQRKIYGSGMTTLIFLNDIIKVFKSLEDAV